MVKTALIIVAVNIAIMKNGNKKMGIVIRQSPTLTILGFGIVFFSIVANLTIILGNGEAGWLEVFVCLISTLLGAILSLRGTVRGITVLPDGIIVKNTFGRSTRYQYDGIELKPMFLAQVVLIKVQKHVYYVSAKSSGVSTLIRNFRKLNKILE